MAQLGNAGGLPCGELVLLGELETVLSGVLDLNEPAPAAGFLMSEGSGGAGGGGTGLPSPSDIYHQKPSFNFRDTQRYIET